MIFLSACTIVKNEEKHLPRWLACVSALADEIIVVDTGSEDRSIEIAKAGGAVVYSLPWQDDFSMAKNFAIEKARGKWILFLDADEYFSPASMAKVREMIEETDRDIRTAGILCRWVNFDEDADMKLQGAAVQLRIFRNLRVLRYKGRIHEALDVPKRYKVLVTKDIEIHHTGYSKTLAPNKLRRNRRLLEMDINEAGGKASLCQKKYLLDCAYGLDELEKTCQLAKEILSNGDAARKELSSDNLSMVYSSYISSLIRLEQPSAEIEPLVNEARNTLPGTAEFDWLFGLYLYKLGDKRALDFLRAGLRIYEISANGGAEKDFMSLSNNAAYLLPGVRRALGIDFQESASL